ncbi:hypothetical protein ACSSVY_001992 [Roseovarius sp. MBR-51]
MLSCLNMISHAAAQLGKNCIGPRWISRNAENGKEVMPAALTLGSRLIKLDPQAH